MRDRYLNVIGALVVVIAVVSLVTVSVAGQAATAAAKTTAATKTWTAPRTPWGDPDIQGVWSNHTLAPFERPIELGEREFVTDEEFAELEARAVRGAATTLPGSDNRRFEPPGDSAPPRDPKSCGVLGCGGGGDYVKAPRRTSLVIDPPNGRLPASTPAGEKRALDRRLGGGTDISEFAIERGYKLDGPEDLGTWVRCITRGLPGSMIPGGYGAMYQILQTPGYVVIHLEMIHETRTIPLDGRPHLGPHIRSWMGDPRGHWEGNTLVVETTNFTDRTSWRGSGPNLRLVERFTRVDADTIDYRFTVDDPESFTKPWTAALPMTTTPDLRVLEYACHEANNAPEIFLGGARAKEAAAGEAAKKKR